MKKHLQRNLITAPVAVTGTNTYATAWQRVDSFDKYMIQVIWSGTPTATVSIKVSADPVPGIGAGEAAATAPTNYDFVASSSLTTTGKNIITYEVTVTSANWIGVQWVNSSGTGTITAVNFVGKGAQV